MMDQFQQLAFAITASDLRYIGGTLLQAHSAPQSWPFGQWGAAVAFEAKKHLSDVHGVEFDLQWEAEFAELARNGSKFLYGGAHQFDQVISSFSTLEKATHESYFPPDRIGGTDFDHLRDDLSVVSEGDQVMLTNVTGHFMAGLPPERAARTESIGAHLMALSHGIGQLTAVFTHQAVSEIREHGSSSSPDMQWWDGKIDQAIPNTFGGELSTPMAFVLISILSTVQTARRFAHATCCSACSAAALKHRFVVGYHAARSLRALADRPELLGPIARGRLAEMNGWAHAGQLDTRRYRNLRNGWLHLGLSDVAEKLAGPIDLLSIVPAYTEESPVALSDLVDSYLSELCPALNDWLLTPPSSGRGLFRYLREPS